MNHLFTVEDVFQIPTRGCILVPGIPETVPNLRVGDEIVLRLPDGEQIKTKIHGLEMINRRIIPGSIVCPILLPPNIRKESVPVGTEVYSENENGA